MRIYEANFERVKWSLIEKLCGSDPSLRFSFFYWVALSTA